MAVLLKGWILPVGGVASVMDLRAACIAGLFYFQVTLKIR